MVVPPDLIVSIVGGVAARRIVHDNHAAKFKKSAADARYVSGVNRYFPENLSHSLLLLQSSEALWRSIAAFD